jgi:hypothetical protein
MFGLALWPKSFDANTGVRFAREASQMSEMLLQVAEDRQRGNPPSRQNSLALQNSPYRSREPLLLVSKLKIAVRGLGPLFSDA